MEHCSGSLDAPPNSICSFPNVVRPRGLLHPRRRVQHAARLAGGPLPRFLAPDHRDESPARALSAQRPLVAVDKANRLDVVRINLERLTRLAELPAVYSSAGQREALGELVGSNIYLCRLALFRTAVPETSLAAVLTAGA